MPSPADDDDLPVAEPVPAPGPDRPADDDLPVATPVAAPVTPPRPGPRGLRREAIPARPAFREQSGPAGQDPPRPRALSACCVIGCFGVAALAAAGVVAFAAVVLVSHLGQEIGPRSSDRNEPGKTSRARPGPITPTKLTQETAALDLSGDCYAVSRGANGRFLLLGVKSRQSVRTSIAVFDPNEAKIVQIIDTGSEPALFAAGMAKLFVHRQNQFERYDLTTGQREKVAAFPFTPTALVVGPGSDGPVLVISTQLGPPVALPFDPEELAPPSRGAAGPVLGGLGGLGPRPAIRVSADGRLVGFGSTTGTGGAVVPFDQGLAGKSVPIGPDDLGGHVAPSPDGRFVYTNRGVFRSDGQSVIGLAKNEKFFYTLPTAHGSDLFVSLEIGPAAGTTRGKVRLHLAGDREPMDEWDVLAPTGLGANDSAENIPADLRVHVWPAAGLAAVLPNTPPTQLKLYKVDVPGMLRDSGRPYLLFGSDPPTTAVRGQTFSYTPEVWSSTTPPPQVEFVSGAQGMKMQGRQLVWDVPTNFEPGEVEVHLQTSDPKTGKTADQKFRVVVLDP